MRKQIVRIFGIFLAVALISPVSFLFSAGTRQQLTLTSKTANWADTEDASQMFNHMQHLAWKVAKEVGPIQVQEVQLTHQAQAAYLDRIRTDVNRLSMDLSRLSAMKSKLEPWQQQLLGRMTPHVHELVYQTRAAIQELDKQQGRLALYATDYPGYIAAISNNASQLNSSIGTFTQSAHAAEKLARIEQQGGPKAS